MPWSNNTLPETWNRTDLPKMLTFFLNLYPPAGNKKGQYYMFLKIPSPEASTPKKQATVLLAFSL